LVPGNGFAKEFGFKMNVRSLLSDIKRADTLDIDVIEKTTNYGLNVPVLDWTSFVAHSFK